MNKRLLTLLTSAVGIVSLTACGPDSIKDVETSTTVFPGSGYVDNDYFAATRLSYNLAVGETKAISYECFPGHYGETLTFTSKDTSVVTVDANGVLTGVKKGYADVEITSENGQVSQTVRVSVSAKAEKTEVQSVIDTIKGNYNDPSYKAPRKMIRREYSEEYYTCDGKQQYGNKSYEVMAYDMDAGYFFVEGPYVTYRVEGGQPEISNGKWLFYSINYGMYVRMIHITSSVKNYFDLNTADYDTYDDAIKGILNCFFVSGEKIVNDALDYYSGKEDFNQFLGFSGTKFSSVDDNSLVITYNESSTDTVDADDEINYFNIPTDTEYSYVYTQELLNSNNHLRAQNVDMTMSYTLEGKPWTRTFNRSQIYDEDFEVTKVQNPKDNGYTLVDTMYDL